MTFAEKIKSVLGLQAQATDGNPTSAYVDLSQAVRCKVVINVEKDNAALTSFTLREAKTDTGGDVRNLVNTVPLWVNLNTGESETLVRENNNNTYALDDASDGRGQLVVFDVDPAKLGINDGFRFLAVTVAAGNADNTASVTYEIDLRETA